MVTSELTKEIKRELNELKRLQTRRYSQADAELIRVLKEELSWSTNNEK